MSFSPSPAAPTQLAAPSGFLPSDGSLMRNHPNNTTGFGANSGHDSTIAGMPHNNALNTSQMRVPLKVSYIVSSQHSASNTLLHFFQSVDERRSALGAPTRRLVIFADEKGFDLPFDQLTQRTVGFSRIEECLMFPADLREAFAAQSTKPTDLDLLMQQTEPFDFTRSVGALYKPNMSGGSPPIFQLDEGQPITARVNCHFRNKPLKEAIVDGISSDALKVISEQHRLQLKAVRTDALSKKDEYTTELVDLYQQRDALRDYLAKVEHQLAQVEGQRRQERDSWRMKEAQLQEELRLAREEVKMMKLVRYGVEQEHGQAGYHRHTAPYYPMNATDNPQQLAAIAQQQHQQQQDSVAHHQQQQQFTTGYAQTPQNLQAAASQPLMMERQRPTTTANVTTAANNTQSAVGTYSIGSSDASPPPHQGAASSTTYTSSPPPQQQPSPSGMLGHSPAGNHSQSSIQMGPMNNALARLQQDLSEGNRVLQQMKDKGRYPSNMGNY